MEDMQVIAKLKKESDGMLKGAKQAGERGTAEVFYSTGVCDM